MTFGLVHGAWHGAWCWERLISELAARGHRAVAVDDDRAIAAGWAERAARERLGVEPLALDGGHAPLLSRPAALAAVLHTVAAGEEP